MALRGERYETLRVIASGGMATVHLGRALGAGGFERLVAIKAMHPHLASEPEFVAMFLDEARLAARIRHPNVVSTLDVQQDEEGVFLVMEYIEGPSLQQVIRALRKSKEAMPEDVLLRIFLDALAGLHAAHELCDASGRPLQLVHRDVSPQNILIGADGIVRITDFGVARAEARLSSTHGGQLKGKIGFMSPEQARSLPVDRRTDIYAAGVILWESLTGERLIRGASEAVMLAIVAAGDHRSARAVNPKVPEALDEVCTRALSRDPDARYATAADFADAVEKAAATAGLRVASTRAVASFINALNAHARPVDLPALPPPTASFPPPVSSRAPPSVEPASGGDASPSQTVVTGPGALSDRAPSSTSAASLPGASAADRRSSKRLLVGAGAVAIAGIAVALLVLRGDDAGSRGRAEPGLEGAPPSPTSQAAKTSPAAGPVVEPAADPSPPAPALAADAGAIPASSAARPPSLVAPEQPGNPSSRRGPAGPAGGATSAKPEPKSPVYRPPEL